MSAEDREKVAVTCARLRAATDRLCNLLMGILDDGDVLEIGRRDADREEIGVQVIATLGELNDVCAGSNLRLDRLTSLTVMLSNERGSVKLKPKMLRKWLDQQGTRGGSAGHGVIRKDCPECEGTGFYGDNGPGIKGNREYVECDSCADAARVESEVAA